MQKYLYLDFGSRVKNVKALFPYDTKTAVLFKIIKILVLKTNRIHLEIQVLFEKLCDNEIN